MAQFVKRSAMPVSARELFDWHERPGAFERLTPGWEPSRVVSRTGGITNGSRVEVEVPLLGGLLHQRLLVEHRDYVAGQQFRDVQIEGPFAKWEHTHRMLALPDGTSVLEDQIDYELPVSPFGEFVAGQFVRSKLERLFEFRHERTQTDLERHAVFTNLPKQTIAITGGTGMIGSALTGLLRTAGHTVLWVTRKPDPSRGDIGWDPAAGTIDLAAMEGVDSVVHLAGANVGERWTPEHKRAILMSREQGTRTIVRALRQSKSTPKTLVSASAIGYYGDTGSLVLDETAQKGTGFLADVTEVWESETRAAPADTRVAIARLGVVLSPAGGALAKMLLPFQLGLGGTLGSGNQWMSWVSLDDAVAALYHLVMTESASGVFNVTAPAPVTNAEFVDTLGDVLNRPTIIPVPAFALRALFGEMAEATILGGQRVLPARLQAIGFTHRHPTLQQALAFELGR